MATIKDEVLYIGSDVYNHLPKEVQKEFEWFRRYSKMYELDGTQFDENGEEVDMEWEGDEVFDDIEDIQDFCGEEDLAVLSMDVYKKIFDVFTGEDEEFFENLTKQISGNQMRLKYE